ncbi:MAG: PAS domain S-box protein [Thermodesulfobacteriota bacterium]
MKQKKPSYEELEVRLHQAEEVLRAIRAGEIDLVIGEKCPFVLRVKEAEDALQKAKEMLELAISGSKTGLWDLQFNHEDPYKIPDAIYLSPQLKEFIGFKEEEFPNSISAWHSRIHPEDLEIVKKSAQEHLEGKKEIHEVEYRIYHKDGSIRWIHSRGKILRDENGIPKRWTGIDWDITDQKLKEQSRKESEEKYRALVERSLQGLLVVQDFRIVYASKRCAEIIGYPIEELLSFPPEKVIALVHPDDQGLVWGRFRERIFGEEVPPHYEYRITGKDGELKWIEMFASLIEYEGKPAVQAAIVDITERKEAEQALRESEERYRLVVENAGDMVILVAQDEHIQFVNRRAMELTGYSYDEFISRPFDKFIHPEDRDKVLQYHARRLKREKGVPEVYSFRIIDKAGNIRWVEINVALINWKGSPATLNFLRDITDLKKFEEEKEILQAQFRQAQKMEAIGRLAGGVAHDFNNMLTIIKTHSQLMLMQLREGDPLFDSVREVERAADRAAALTRQLLAFSRRQVMEFRVLDLNVVIRDMEKMLRRVLGEDIELVTYYAGDLGRVKADPGQIEQILMNLVVNARDAMPKGGKLTIETANVDLDEEYVRRHVGARAGAYVMLSVTDIGVGMSSEVRERIFEPFFTTKEKGKGTGLGLSTVYGIVKQSGGNIWVYSELGKGTTFKVYLPRCEEVAEEVGRKEEVKEIPRGGEVILVVEDDETVRKLAVGILRRFGYEVLEAGLPGEALLLGEQRKERIDLLLTDVVMPQMSGRELGERIRRFHPEVRVLYMSGYTDNAIVHHGVLESGIAFMQKPFTVEGLARKVREVLDKKE